MKKLGRNSSCPCGSGTKFKRCHGTPTQLELQHTTLRLEHEARERQRSEQQGWGRPIISTQLDDLRIVVVGRHVHAGRKWRTFHDFLQHYPRMVLGDDWWRSEERKPVDAQHPVVAWRTLAVEQAQAYGRPQAAGGLPSTGALSTFMHFAYDLYALEHSEQVETLLIARLKNAVSFSGATYEVRVAASFLRAGFTLDLEDESDRRSSHVEFVATHTATGKKYSVEAKRREGKRLNTNKLLYSALSKKAEHSRIVFIDTNDARLEPHRNESIPLPLAETKAMLKRYAQDPIGKTLPAAYVIATHAPEEHHLNTVNISPSLLLVGFRLDDLEPGYKTLLEQVEIRRRHSPVFELVKSMSEHGRIPASFDGEADAFAIRPAENRLKIGSRFVVAGPEGLDVEAVLENGVVVAQEKLAWCTFLAPTGLRFFSGIPLTEAELEAYEQHPSTFFGVTDHNAGRKPLKTSIDYFDFFWEGYSCTPKERLLEFMKYFPSIEELTVLSQYDLATRYCARMAELMISTSSAHATVGSVS
ncbi:SEC-C domain-containing protein [Pseudomonas alliivorans]|nr:SEC-C domain-containing protein [Pseudomonas alliivorans]